MTRSMLCSTPAERSQFSSVAPEFYTGDAARGKRFFTVGEPVGVIVIGRKKQGHPLAVAAGCRLLWGPYG